MRIAVIGTGRIGLVLAACLAHLRHEVTGLDIDEAKISKLRDGNVPFYEPGLEELVHEGLVNSTLTFTSDPADALGSAEAAFICVDTPSNGEGEAVLTSVERATLDIARHARDDIVIIEKSTVPAGTAERIRQTLTLSSSQLASTDIVSNPEFLREGSAVEDTLRPDRLLVGASSERGFATLRAIYHPLLDDGVRLIETNIASAELAKHACNAFLALKISFANALARLCERAGADVVDVADVMGADARIGSKFLKAGLGYGGYCFPKDLAAFENLASELGYDFPLLREVARINEETVESVLEKIKDALWNLEGKYVTLLGLSFKPDTDDVRFSPALALSERLIAEGAKVVGYDPEAAESAKTEVPELQIATDAYEAAHGAHCVVLCTEWQEFDDLDLERIRNSVNYPIVVDARNVFEPEKMRSAGFTHYPVGRPPVQASSPELGHV